MENKSGAEFRAELKNIKDKFLNDLSVLESEIVQSYENAPKDDNFNINQLYIAIREVDIIVEFISNLYTDKEKKIKAINFITRKFTTREKEIFELVIKGHSAKYIADKLSRKRNNGKFLKKSAIDKHLENMLKKIENDGLLVDILKHSERFKEFENDNYITDKKNKDGECRDNKRLKNPTKLLRYLFEIFTK